MTSMVLHELVGTELRRPRGRREFETFNPATEQPIAMVPEASPVVVEEAIAAAREAFDDGPWPSMSAAERAEALEAAADAIEARISDFALAETSDTGMTLKMTMHGHVPRAVSHLRYFAREVARTGGECFSNDGAWLHLVQREPLGVVAILPPWSAPLTVATINVAAALASGNTVVLKSPERAPMTMGMLAEVFAIAGFPAGVMNVIHGTGEVTGAALVSSAAVDGLCFVGGTQKAAHIMAESGQPFRRNTLELGGKSATIVLEDARLEDAVDGALLSVFSSNGEVCTAGSRLLVHTTIFEAFAKRFEERTRRVRVGDPCDPLTEVGPLIDAAHLESVKRWVERGVLDGAQLLCGGERPPGLSCGHYLSPALLTGVHPRSPIAQEEIFGPVAILIPFSDNEEAIALANDTPYALAATVWCADASRGISLARRLRAGVIAVNSPIIRDIRVPFGGMRASGLGRVGGRWNIEQFTEVKTISIPVDGQPLPQYGL